MGVGRKSPGAVMAYDPVVRWKARAWALVTYLAVLAAVSVSCSSPFGTSPFRPRTSPPDR